MNSQEFDSIWGKALSGEEAVDEAAQRWKDAQSAGGRATGNLASSVSKARAEAPPGQANTPEVAEPPAAPMPGAELPDPRARVSEKVKALLQRKV